MPSQATQRWPIVLQLYARRRAMGVAIMAARQLVRFFWRVLDRLDYWLTQARLRLADRVCGSLPDGDPSD